MAMLGLKSLLVYLILPDDQRLFASNYNRETIDDNQTGEEFLEEILRRLKCKEYSEVYGLIIAASDGIIMSVYRELFRAIFDEYDDDFNESGVSDSNLENTLVLLKSYGTTKNKLSVVLECSDRANSWKAFIMLGSFMEEIMPEMEDLSEHLIYDIVKVYIPSWIERFEKNVVLNYSNDQLNKEYFSYLEADYLDQNRDAALPDASSDLFLAAVLMFLRIFTLSMSTNYKLLDDLSNKVLACTHIQSHYMEIFIMKMDEIYKFSARRLPLNTPVLVNSLKSKFYSLPQVFSPEHYLKLAIRPLHYSLHVSTSNMFNIGYVVLILRNCLLSIKDESIERDEHLIFLEFLADFLICCEECTLGEVRAVCMDTFKLFLSKFEPVAQLLIIRKLFSMIRGGEIQRKNLHKIHINDEKSLKFEPHFFAWIVDLFRSKLNYEVFRRELNFFWGDITTIRYSSLSDGLQYYLSAFILAQEQALRQIDPELMLNIYNCYLQPLQTQISDWTELVNVEQRQINRRRKKMSTSQLALNMERLEKETRRQQDSQSLSLLQFQYLETLNFVTTFLRSAHLL